MRRFSLLTLILLVGGAFVHSEEVDPKDQLLGSNPQEQMQALKKIMEGRDPSTLVMLLAELNRVAKDISIDDGTRMNAAFASSMLDPTNTEHTALLLKLAADLRTETSLNQVKQVLQKQGDSAVPIVQEAFQNNDISWDLASKGLSSIGTTTSWEALNQLHTESKGHDSGKSPSRFSHENAAPNVTKPGTLRHEVK